MFDLSRAEENWDPNGCRDVCQPQARAIGVGGSRTLGDFWKSFPLNYRLLVPGQPEESVPHVLQLNESFNIWYRPDDTIRSEPAGTLRRSHTHAALASQKFANVVTYTHYIRDPGCVNVSRLGTLRRSALSFHVLESNAHAVVHVKREALTCVCT